LWWGSGLRCIFSREHRRRGGYWRVYHLAHTLELDSLVKDIVGLVKECCPPVRVRLSRRKRCFEAVRRIIHIKYHIIAIIEHPISY
jgi:hypothetical protein